MPKAESSWLNGEIQEHHTRKKYQKLKLLKIERRISRLKETVDFFPQIFEKIIDDVCTSYMSVLEFWKFFQPDFIVGLKFKIDVDLACVLVLEEPLGWWILIWFEYKWSFT